MNCTAEMLRLYAVTDRAWVGEQTLPQQVKAAGMEMKDVLTEIVENQF